MLCGLGNYFMSELTNKLITDNRFNKLVYYKNEKGNILELPELDDPFEQLKEQVFNDRRPSKVLEKQDVCVFIYLDDNSNISATDRRIKTVYIRVGFVVHNNCSKTGVGIRESAMISEIQRIVEESRFKYSIGKCKAERPIRLNGLPFSWNGYEMRIKMDGFNR